MSKRTVHRGEVAAVFAIVFVVAAGPAAAAGQRSFVSTGGVDNPTCSIGSPCRTFGAAVSSTTAGGEVIALDSGGYGPVTIAQPVSIIAPAGIYAGISVTSGNGVTISTPNQSDRVVLAGLTINNQGSSGNGIEFIGAGKLEVARTTISGFSSGSALRFAPALASQGELYAVDMTVKKSDFGIWIVGGSTNSQRTVATLERIDALGNTNGLQGSNAVSIVATHSAFNRNGPTGIRADTLAGTYMLMTFDRCSVSHNTFGAATQGGGSAYITFTGSTIAQNGGFGLAAGPGSEFRLAGSTIAHNVEGINAAGGGVSSQGNNFIYGNTVDGLIPVVVGSK